MQTLEAKVLSILKLRPTRGRNHVEDQSNESDAKLWRMRVSYPGPATLYEMELREPLKLLASKRQTIGMNGLVEFEMLSEPVVAAGDRILIDAYEPGEKILG
jgi:hypothetical protein